MSHCSLAHAKLTFAKEVTVIDAIVAVMLMEASLNGCGKLLDKINALHTTFAAQPEQEYVEHGMHRESSFILSIDTCLFVLVHLVLDWLKLPDLRDAELKRIATDYDLTVPWTENDEYEKRTMPREFKKPPTPSPQPAPHFSIPNTARLLSTQIAYREKQHDAVSNPRPEQYSTPYTMQQPVFNDKLSPIDKVKPVTRINTQILVPIDENTSMDEQRPVKRQKVEETPSEFSSGKSEDPREEESLSTLDDIQEDDLIFWCTVQMWICYVLLVY